MAIIITKITTGMADKNFIFLLKSLKASKYQIYKEIILKANLRNILNTMKINISMNLIGQVV